MKTINYPILFYKLQADNYLGILVGTEYQLIDKSILDIKNGFRTFLQKQYKRFDDLPNINLKESKLKVMTVKIRPTYRTNASNFPTNHILEIDVPLIYGATEYDFFECYLPLFNSNFVYYDQKQFTALAKHAATYFLDNEHPEKLYNYTKYEQPKLELIPLRINEDRFFNFEEAEKRRGTKVLSKMATQYPYSKVMRQKISAFPDAAWEQEHKVEMIVEKITFLKSNILLVGKHGVGKSSILKQVIKKVTNSSRKKKVEVTFWQLMSQRITSFAKYMGDWQKNCEDLIEDLERVNGVLWVVDLMQLIMNGGSGPEDSIASFFISYLQLDRLQILGEVTPEELESMRRMLPGFVENFQIVMVDELPESKVLKILDKFAAFSNSNLKLEIKKDALELSYRLLNRYFPYESFPGKAVKFLAACVSDAEMMDNNVITQKEVISNFIKQTGLPELFLRDDILLDQVELKDYFQSRIIGQPAAIDQMSGIVKVFKAGLNNPGKPITTLIFAGPTGVGKTASAKALAEYFFGKGQKQSPLIRIDMSEFQFPYQISRFIGAGKEVGTLVRDVRERKFTVLLLDEVEKAAPSIFDALLNVLDEGMLVDAYGRVTNFRNTIIIMTTNLGASNSGSIGFGKKTVGAAQFETAIARHFRPEFVNRIDGIVHFNPLNKENINEIAVKELEELKSREGFVKRKINIEFTQKLIDYIVKNGFDEKYGARPLQRTIEQELINPLAAWLLQHPKVENKTIRLDYSRKLLIDMM